MQRRAPGPAFEIDEVDPAVVRPQRGQAPVRGQDRDPLSTESPDYRWARERFGLMPRDLVFWATRPESRR